MLIPASSPEHLLYVLYCAYTELVLNLFLPTILCLSVSHKSRNWVTPYTVKFIPKMPNNVHDHMAGTVIDISSSENREVQGSMALLKSYM